MKPDAILCLLQSHINQTYNVTMTGGSYTFPFAIANAWQIGLKLNVFAGEADWAIIIQSVLACKGNVSTGHIQNKIFTYGPGLHEPNQVLHFEYPLTHAADIQFMYVPDSVETITYYDRTCRVLRDRDDYVCAGVELSGTQLFYYEFLRAQWFYDYQSLFRSDEQIRQYVKDTCNRSQTFYEWEHPMVDLFDLPEGEKPSVYHSTFFKELARWMAEGGEDVKIDSSRCNTHWLYWCGADDVL